MLDRHNERLGQTPESERAAVVREVRGLLAAQLVTILQKYPDAVVDLAALVRERQDSGGSGAANMTAENNSDSQIIMTAGPITGGNFNFRTEPTR